jgi:hypothetical protein
MNFRSATNPQKIGSFLLRPCFCGILGCFFALLISSLCSRFFSELGLLMILCLLSLAFSWTLDIRHSFGLCPSFHFFYTHSLPISSGHYSRTTQKEKNSIKRYQSLLSCGPFYAHSFCLSPPFPPWSPSHSFAYIVLSKSAALNFLVYSIDRGFHCFLHVF